jgi:hypothetical protein
MGNDSVSNSIEESKFVVALEINRHGFNYWWSPTTELTYDFPKKLSYHQPLSKEEKKSQI